MPGSRAPAGEQSSGKGSGSSRAGLSLLDPARVERLNDLYRLLVDLHLEDREQRRYGNAASQSEPCLCTPVGYQIDSSHIPQRILDIDYGCGDPTRYASAGETVLDLGSGSGKHCFLMARQVGSDGHVIGIDKTPAMLTLARGAVDEVTAGLGYARPMVEFRRGHIENLTWDLERLETLTGGRLPASYQELDELARELESTPLVASNSIDLVVSNCVLNLVADHRKPALFRELHRVLRPGGRAIISDIVADRDIPVEMKADDALWTGCISGALRRDHFLEAFCGAGFYGVEELSAFHWLTEGGIHFHSVTVAAHKGKEGPCYQTYRKAFYRGPFSAVEDDDGHRYPRGHAIPVCEKTANLLTRAPYQGHFLVSEPLADAAEKLPFDCSGGDRPGSDRSGGDSQPGLISPEHSNGNTCDPSSGCC